MGIFEVEADQADVLMNPFALFVRSSHTICRHTNSGFWFLNAAFSFLNKALGTFRASETLQ